MGKYVTVDKRSKKAQKEYYASARRTWGDVNPASRTFKDKTKFNKSDRNKSKAALRGRQGADKKPKAQKGIKAG